MRVWNAVLIEEEVIDGPTTRSVLGVRDAHLSLDEDQAPRVGGVDLVSDDEVGVLGDEALERPFGIVSDLAKLSEPSLRAAEDHAVGVMLVHCGSRAGARTYLIGPSTRMTLGRLPYVASSLWSSRVAPSPSRG